MALTNRERVGRMLELVAAGLKPVVEREFSKVYGSDWIDVVANERQMAIAHAGIASSNDPQFLLNAVQFHWKETLGRTLGNAEGNYVAELREVRNRWAHPRDDQPFTSDDVYRAIDTGERLLRSVAAPEAETLARARSAILQQTFEAAYKTRAKEAAATAVSGEPAKGLRPWREVMTPHPDVAAGRYRQAEFAADLSQVDRGEGAPEYVNPREFFARTFLTEGLRLLLVGGLRRLGGTGGESIVDLQTTFGGGKTHSLLALYHLVASGANLGGLPGVEPVLKEAGVASLPPVTRAVLVGTALSPVSPRQVNGTEIRTLWGELAWQLGGPKTFASVSEADRQGIPPGADVLRSVLSEHAPVLLLIDEWVTYARLQWGNDSLPGGTFDAAVTFAQQLTQAVDQVPGSLLVVSLPESAIEVGGEGGRKALESLKHHVHRMDAPWKPAAAQESFEIVRRRLFEPISMDAVPDRDEVVQRFSELYAAHSGAFPSETHEKPYLERLRACYPIHPELFDRLFDDWSTLERFQRTRGVLKLMAAVVHALWERQDANLMVTPASIPLDDATVLPQLTQYLDDNWAPVIESDVDGPNSLPLRVDRENPAYGRYSAARRVARTVFLGSAPLPAAANRGIEERRVLLGSVQPGETPTTFGDALRKLASQATYLYPNQGRYWYATQPSVNQLARDRASGLPADRVEQEIEKRLKSAVADRGAFARVHAAPRSAADVPDEDEVALVVVGPEHPHDAKSPNSRALRAAGAFLGERGAGPRTNQNMLVFLVADSIRLDELKSATREYLAWRSITEDGEAGRLDLDKLGRTTSKTQQDSADQAVAARIPEAYQWLLVPEQDEATANVSFRAIRVSGTEGLAVRAGRKLINEELLIVDYGGVNLRLVLEAKLGDYWREHHVVGLRELWSWFARYLYLPRLRDISVLEGAVRDGVASLLWRTETFAYAAAREESGEFRGLVAGEAGETRITSTAVLIDPSILPDPLPGHVEPAAKEIAPPPEPAIRRVRRFHGEATLVEPKRPIPELTQIVDEVIARLAQATDVSLQVRLEVDAEHKGTDGFSDDTVRTISENAKALRFKDFDWEKE